MTQAELAERIGASEASVCGWEVHGRQAELRFMPAILDLLGYDPRPEPVTLGERVRAKREAMGLSQTALAAQLALDPSTVRDVEAGRRKLTARCRALIAAFLGQDTDGGVSDPAT